jgi:hypothetical protein
MGGDPARFEERKCPNGIKANRTWNIHAVIIRDDRYSYTIRLGEFKVVIGSGVVI